MESDEVLVVDYVPSVGPPTWATVAELPPRVVVLRAGPHELADIVRRARLAMVRLPDGAERVAGDERALDDLDDAARLFVTAWRERPVSKADRPGEGLPWDHPGFQPPDLPHR